MKKKNRVFALFLVFSMIIGSLSQNILVFASDTDVLKENEAVFYEIVSTPNEDNTEINVEVKIKPKENISVNTIVLPDGSEQTYADAPVIYTVKENGLISFQLKYTEKVAAEEETNENASGEKDVSIEYEVKNIKEKTIEETPKKEEKAKEHVEDKEANIATEKRAVSTASNGTDLADWKYTEKNGEILLTKYIGTSTDVIVPGRLDGKRVVIVTYENNWLANRKIFPDTITSIVVGSLDQKVKISNGYLAYLFYEKKELKSADLRGLEFSNITNAEGLFEYSGVKEVKIDGWDTSNLTNASYMFSYCDAMTTTPDVSNWDTSNLTNASYMFSYCLAMEETPDVSNWDTSNLTDTSDMFWECIAMTETPDVSNWDTSNLTDTSDMFCGCIAMTETPDVSNWDTSNLTSTYRMFRYCSALTTPPDVNNWDTSKLEDIRGMFGECDKLSVFDVSNWKLNGSCKVESAFSYGGESFVPTIIIANTPVITDNLDSIAFHRIPAGPKYNANGGKFADGATERTYFDSIFVADKAQLQTTQKAVAEKYVPTKDGKVFGGWYLDKECTVPYKADNTPVDLTSAKSMNDTILYAKWLGKYTVNFDSMGGSPVASITDVQENDTIKKPADPTRQGYFFLDWYTDTQYIQRWDFDKGMVTSNMTLYARWTPINYTVKYDTQGGSAIADKEKVEWNDANLLPADEPTKDGATFMGWKLADKDVDNTMTYESLVKDDTVKSITLVAVWKDCEYSVKYETGFDDVVIADKENVKWNDANLFPDTPKKDGYGFIGWELNGKEVLATDKYSDLAKDQTDGTFITLTAKWVELTDYSILYNPNGGSMPENTPSTLTGLKYADKVPAPIPLREGYTFKGWKYNDKEVKENSLYKDLETDGDVKQIELVSDWEINKYNVEYIFTSKDAPTDVKVPSKEIVEYNTTLTEPQFKEYKGWTFSGWYVDEALTQKFDFTTQIKADTKLYGAWDYKEEVKPVEPENPEKPDKPTPPSKGNENTSQKGNTPKTGDISNMVLWLGLLATSGSLLLFIPLLSKKKRR